jgi:two-component system, NarL family, response regulator DevR
MTDPETGTMRVLLVDDHTSFRQSLAFMLDREPDITVVGQAQSIASGRAEIARVRSCDRIDIAIVDLGLPDGSGVDIIRLLHQTPAPHRPRVLVLTAETIRSRFADAVESGADAVLNKTVSLATIVDAVRRLHSGEDLLSPRETIDLLRLAALKRQQSRAGQEILASLTTRERDVLAALGLGLSDREIGKHLSISNQTVRTHMVNLLAKLRVDSRLQALVFALKHGAIDLNEFDR